MGEHHQDNRTRSTRIIRQSTFHRPFIFGVATAVVILAGVLVVPLCTRDGHRSRRSHPPAPTMSAHAPCPSTSARRAMPRPSASHHPHTSPTPEPAAQQQAHAQAPATPPATVTHTATASPTQAPTSSASPSKKCVINALGICVPLTGRARH